MTSRVTDPLALRFEAVGTHLVGDGEMPAWTQGVLTGIRLAQADPAFAATLVLRMEAADDKALGGVLGDRQPVRDEGLQILLDTLRVAA